MEPIAIPRELTDIDADWLGAVLDTQIVSVADAGPTGGIAMTSRVVRLRLESSPAGSAPPSIVVKFSGPGWTDDSALHEREVRFYRKLAAGHGLPAPACLHADFDRSTGAFVLVLQDLGELRPGHRLQGLDTREAEAVADALAQLHARWWQDPAIIRLGVRGHSPERIAQTMRVFDQRLRALEEDGRYPLGSELLGMVPEIRRTYAEGMRAISSNPQTLVHCDLHVENFFLEQVADGYRLFIIDWQNAHHGHCAFDVCQMVSSLRPEVTLPERERLLLRYHQQLGRPGYPLERLRLDVAAALRHQFIGTASWFATITADTPRDAATIEGHWTRLASALTSTAAW